MASSEAHESGLLNEKLKDQVAVSIKDSLNKATSILSNLHRVQSYLDVVKTMPTSRAGGHSSEGIKNALEQIRTVRTDTATLLQTIYLTEIGLQSLQDFDKQGQGSSSSGGLSSLMPILSEVMNTTGLSITGGQGGAQRGEEDMVDLPPEEMQFVAAATNTDSTLAEGMPPPKKM